MHLPYLIITHLLAFLLPIAYIVSASPSPAPAPDPYPAVISLPARVRPTSRHATPVTPASPVATSEVEHDLLPFVIVSTIDGALHAIDRDNGKVRWTLRDGVEPLVGGGVKGKGGEEDYIVEPAGGGLYVFEEGEEDEPKVRKLPLSVDQLIELSPFTFPHSPSRIFTGSKQSSLLTVDLRNGQHLNCFSSFANANSSEECVCENDQMLDDMESRSRSNRDVLFIGRTDYRLTIHTPVSPGLHHSASSDSQHGLSTNERKKQAGAQEISYSTYTPNSFDRPLADLWATMGQQELYDEDGDVIKRMRVELRHDGAAIGVEQGTGARWSTLLGSPGIAVYDILLPLSPSHANPILVPQPPPHLPSLFPRGAKPLPPHLDFLNKAPSTYIGQVPFVPLLDQSESASDSESESKSKSDLSPNRPLFYALSSSRYPLINLAPPPRPGALANGSFQLSEDLPERDQLLPYLLDPPNEGSSQTAGTEDSLTTQDEMHPDDVRARGKDRGTRRRGWGLVWWINIAFAALLLVGSSVVGVYWRRSKSAEAVSPGAVVVDEKSPLLLMERKASETKRTVTFAVPEETDFQNTALEKVGTNTENGTNGDVEPKEGTEGSTPGKKKSTRRRVRGKKKPKNTILNGSTGDEDNEDEDEEGSGSGSGSGQAASPGTAEKPLPDLPREMSAVDLTHLTVPKSEDAHAHGDKEHLSISDTVIGYGSHGTVVLKGTWGSRAVAVKRLLSDFTRLASQEVKLLQASDDHPNVIRYYCQEKRDNFLYIALDLCQASLADLIESPDRYLELASVLDRKKALREVSGGLRHLHGMKIIHRDIKPQNVLVSKLKDGSLRMLVSDFGLARRLEHDQSSFAPTGNNLAGSIGWRAPECIRGQVRLHDTDRFSHSSSSSQLEGSGTGTEDAEDGNTTKTPPATRLTKAVDLFALGCLYFWVLMSGQHPYGEVYDRESNIVKGETVGMDRLEILGEEGVEARELIEGLLSVDPTKRPETSDCLTHPFFWTPAKRLAFLCDASDRFEILNHDPPEPPIVALESTAIDVIGKDWFSRADKVFTSNLGKYRKYKGNSVRDLLRAMRNKKHHYQDLEPSAQRHFGSLPAGFLTYFTSRYPRLFLHVYGVVKDGRLRHEPMFEGYFSEA